MSRAVCGISISLQCTVGRIDDSIHKSIAVPSTVVATLPVIVIIIT
jgi:hypothetical protein